MQFDDAWKQFEGIQYGYTKEEAAALWYLASEPRTPHAVRVEVGSMQGGSACLIEATGRGVICIDPIENNDYYAMFLANTGGKSIKHFRQKDSELWGDWWGDINFLHIDHDHSYETTLASLLNWRRHLTSDAVVLVHDYEDSYWVDVKPAVHDSGLKVQGVVGRLAWGTW